MWKEVLLGGAVAALFFLSQAGINIWPVIVVVGGIIFFYYFMPGKDLIGSKIGIGKPATSKITFLDIGGQEVAKRELKEALDFALDKERTEVLGIRPLKGILLSGPPGTGKTLLAKAAANYTGSAFLHASGSEFVEMYAGVGAKRIRDLFDKARSLARENKKGAVIFIDEIEVLCGARGRHASHLEYDQTLNQLLVEMDGISSQEQILIIGATNRIDILDPAILRPGRFDRIVRVDLPDKAGRLHILKIHTKEKPLASDVDLTELARECYGFSGAHIESLVNEAAINAHRRNELQISWRDFSDAQEKVMLGEKLDRKPPEEELNRVAVHEVGHAIFGEFEKPRSVSSVTIVPRGQALGFVRQAPVEDKYLYTKDELLGQIRVALAGAYSEDLVFGSMSTGSQNDFSQASRLAKTMVLAGLSSLGIVAEELGQDVLNKEIMRIINQEGVYVKKELASLKEFIVKIAEYLKDKERIEGEKFRQILNKHLNTEANKEKIANDNRPTAAS
ncbi:MAG: AAA family ATPase [Firmicutes bacterium]|nr:AAA family ATPase [Bacillota bacterium]MDD4693996.1 AAA family ATPase [Bacillota bacterium]